MPGDPIGLTVSDEELACRAQRGCAESLDALLRRFQSPVLHFLRHRGPAAEAEDLLQDTFLCAYQNLHRYRRRWRFATWLFTIARRQSINRFRRWRPPMAADDVMLSAAPGPETSEIVAAEDHRRRLWAVAAKILSEEETTALWLHYVEEMPTRDIATVVGRSRVAVKTMLFRARRRLLPHLEKLDGRALDRDDSAAFGQPVPLEVHDV